MLLGEQAAETIEMVTWGILKAGTSVSYANGSTRAGVNTAIELNDVRRATRSLRAAKGKFITRMLSGSPNIGTVPVEGGYIAFAHTDCEADIRGLAGFTPVADYGSRKPLCPEECGSVETVRFILSPQLEPFLAAGSGTLNGMKSVGAANVDVYPVIVISMEAYGLVPLKGMSAITPTVINPGTITKSDPLGQRGYAGWKTYFTAVRLNEAWMERIEVGVTDI
jgi:N4-gp56 family major capsid protein